MGKAQVVRRFNAPAETLWSYLSWRGMEKLAGGGFFKRVVFEGEGSEVGATKWIHLAEGPPLRERLEWLDAAGYGYGYRVVDSGPLPITGGVPDARNPPSGCRFRDRCPQAVARCGEEVPLLREIAPGRRAACHLI